MLELESEPLKDVTDFFTKSHRVNILGFVVLLFLNKSLKL